MKKPYIFPLLLGSLVLTGCANGQIDAMQMRLNQQEQQIRLLNSQLSGVQPAQADTWAQVQSLRQEMSAVKGQIDDFNNATAAAGGLPGLAQRVNNHEAALQAIATQFGMELPVAAAPGAPGAAPSAPGMPDSTAAAPVPAAPAMQPQQAAAPAPQQAAPQTQAQGDIAKALYDNGVQSFPQLQAGPQVLLGFYGHVRQAQARFQRVVLARRVQLPAWELPGRRTGLRTGHLQVWLQREGRFRVPEAGDVLHQGREEGRRQGPLAGTHQEIPQVA